MNTSKQKKYRISTLVLVFVSCVFFTCQDTNAVIEEFNKDFYNTSGKTGNDIHFVFKGVSVSELQAATVWTWNNQNFPAPTYGKVVDEPVVTWTGDYGNDPTKKLHVGVWLDLDKLPKSFKFKHILLTYNGGVIQKVPACAKPKAVYVSEEFVGIEITSPIDDPGIIVDDVKYAFRSESEQLPLRDLNGDNTTIDWIPTPESFELNPDQTVRIADVAIPPESTYILVTARVRFTGETEPNTDAGHVFFESEVPQPPTRRPPTVSQWGLIIMALLLVTVGAIMIRKRRLVTT